MDLTVLKFINQISIVSPIDGDDSYVGQMVWVSTSDLTITYMNRQQTYASTVLCRAPTFQCREVYNETIVDDGFVLPNDKSLFSRTEAYFNHSNFVENKTNHMGEYMELDAHEFKYSSKFGPTHGMLKRLVSTKFNYEYNQYRFKHTHTHNTKIENNCEPFPLCARRHYGDIQQQK